MKTVCLSLLAFPAAIRAEAQERLRTTLEQPQFIGDLNAFVTANVHYPDGVRETGLYDSRAIIHFWVCEDGRATDPVVVRHSCPELERELLRMFWAMPLWKPGAQRGIPIDMEFTLPILLCIE